MELLAGRCADRHQRHLQGFRQQRWFPEALRPRLSQPAGRRVRLRLAARLRAVDSAAATATGRRSGRHADAHPQLQRWRGTGPDRSPRRHGRPAVRLASARIVRAFQRAVQQRPDGGGWPTAADAAARLPP
ncbi:unnamed protein product [Rotaria sp. Silwood1]|nr:unnamed protein product [Rotaria sp. Silwood1]